MRGSCAFIGIIRFLEAVPPFIATLDRNLLGGCDRRSTSEPTQWIPGQVDHAHHTCGVDEERAIFRKMRVRIRMPSSSGVSSKGKERQTGDNRDLAFGVSVERPDGRGFYFIAVRGGFVPHQPPTLAAARTMSQRPGPDQGPFRASSIGLPNPAVIITPIHGARVGPPFVTIHGIFAER